MKTPEGVTLEQLKEILLQSAKDFIQNDSVLNTWPEERSGFYSGIEWTLKKLNKAGLLKVND